MKEAAAKDIESPLVLGTAQLGMHYGAVNQFGKPDVNGACAIVEAAWEGGIRFFDTSQQYGDAEAVLGRALRGLGSKGVRVISKLSPQIDGSDRGEVFRAVEGSLERLGIPKLWGLMLHHQMGKALEEDNWDSLYPVLSELRSQGMIDRIGVSPCYPDLGLSAMDREGLEFIQVPFNLLDRRILNNGLVDTAASRGVMLFIRSIYLQGVLLARPELLPEKMCFAVPILAKVWQLVKELGLEPGELFMGYVMGKIPHARILFGAETAGQVTENLALIRKLPLEQRIIKRLDCLADQVDDHRVYDPIEWFKMGIQQVR